MTLTRRELLFYYNDDSLTSVYACADAEDHLQDTQFCHDHIARIDRNGRESVKRVYSDKRKEILGMRNGSKQMGLKFIMRSANIPESNRVNELNKLDAT